MGITTMTNVININEIASLIIKVISFILLVVVIPYIKKKYSQQKLDEINGQIQTYVEAAEQIFGKDEGKEKKEWVCSKLFELGIDVDLDYIDATIESCVLLLHNALRS